MPPVLQPAGNDSSMSISHLNQNPYSDKSLEFNIRDIDEENNHREMMDHEAAPPLPTPFDHSRSSNMPHEPP